MITVTDLVFLFKFRLQYYSKALSKQFFIDLDQDITLNADLQPANINSNVHIKCFDLSGLCF